jgi:hypothetical protein
MGRVFADSNGTDIFDRAVFIDMGRLHFGGYVNRELGYGATKTMFFMKRRRFFNKLWRGVLFHIGE